MLQYLDGVVDFFVMVDYWVEFVVFGMCGQVDGVFFQCLLLFFGIF